MQETGGTALTPIGENGKNMLLYKIVSRLNKELQLFQGSESQHGFIERLGELMTERKRYGIDAEALRAFGDHAAPVRGVRCSGGSSAICSSFRTGSSKSLPAYT